VNAAPFAVTTPSTSVELGPTRNAELVVSVTNVTGRALRARLRVRPDPPADPSWFGIAGDAERAFEVGATNAYTVVIRVPSDVAPGSYTFRCGAHAEEAPEEIFTDGPAVAVTVGPPKETKHFPWWIVAVVLVVLVLVTVVIAILWPRDGGDRVASGTDPVGDAGSGRPDLTSATIRVNDGGARFEVAMAPGTFDPSSTMVSVLLDTDRDPSTGSPGTDGGCVTDADSMGTDLVLQVRPGESRAQLLRATGGCNRFARSSGGTVTVTPNGYVVVLTRDELGADDGLEAKATVATQLDGGATTAILDRMTDAGQPPISLD